MSLTCALLATAIPAPAQRDRPVQTFPEFVGTWLLDRSATTGRVAQGTAVALTIATTSIGLTVTRVLDLPPEQPGREGRRLATNTPPPETYRFDGMPTIRYRGMYEYSYTLLVVAGTLALSEKTVHWVRRGDPLMSNRNAFTLMTDVYALDGGALSVRRQHLSVNGDGEIVGVTPNDARYSYVYRRAPAPVVP